MKTLIHLTHMPQEQKIGYVLLLTGIVLCMLQLWLPTWYLTGDGPCHVANAQVLHDMWQDKHTAFYSGFYTINKQLNPNWITHLLLALLLHVTDGFTAEKILQSIIVLSFIGSFYLLLRQLNRLAALWPLVIFVFVFQNAFSRGFYNFSFSLSFFCIVVYSWLQYLEKRSWWQLALVMVLLLLTWFTHPVAFVFSVFTCGFLAISHRLARTIDNNMDLAKVLGVLLLGTMPALLLFLKFSDREGGLGSVHLIYNWARWWHFARMAYLFNYAENEKIVLGITGWILTILFGAALWLRIIQRNGVNKYDGLIAAVVAGLMFFFCFPDWMLGGGLFSMRAALLTYVLVCCCCAYMPLPRQVQNTAGILLFVSYVALFAIRLPVMKQSEAEMADHLQIRGMIKPYSVLMPLNLAPAGKGIDGKTIVYDNNIFCHAAQYLSVGVPVIVLDNYEAHTGYFPLKWKEERDPYIHLGNIEAVPPTANIQQYEAKAGVKIDYVALYDNDPGFAQDTGFASLLLYLSGQYHIIYSSTTGKTILYERN